MAVADAINELKQGVSNAYTSVQAKGGVIPENKNVDNLAAAIDSISGGGEQPIPDTQYGAALLYLDASTAWIVDEEGTQGCTVQSIDQEAFASFAEEHPLEEWMAEQGYQFEHMGGNEWELFTMEGSITISDEDFQSTTGINVVLDDTFARLCVKFDVVIDKSVPPEWVEVLSSEEYEGLNDDGGNNTVGGQKRFSGQFEAFVMGSEPVSTPDGFLQKTAISSFYMGKNTVLESIGDSFLGNCENLESEIVLPDSVTTIGKYFLAGCAKFNKPFSFPQNISEIGVSFLASCSSFDQDIRFPEGIEVVPNYFLYSTWMMSSNVVFPEGVTTLSEGVLSNIGDTQAKNVGYGGVFFPNSLRTLGEFVLHNEWAFRRIVLPEGVVSCGQAVLADGGMESVVLPTTLTTMKDNFLLNCPHLVLVEVHTTSLPEKSENQYFCLANHSGLSTMTGITLIGQGAATWLQEIPSPWNDRYWYRAIKTAESY